MFRPVTILDVARVAGVSPATVSRALNNSSRVSDDLADRVRAAADELGYRPNATAQGLVRGSTQTIGVIVPDLSNPFFPEILKSVAAAAGQAGHTIVVADSNEDPDEELRLALELSRRVDGVLLCSPRMSAEGMRVLVAERLPFVCTNRDTGGAGPPSVRIDSFDGMLALAAHLVELGHRRVVYLAGPEASWSDRERRRALDAAKRFGLEHNVISAGSMSQEGFEATPLALEHEASAIVCFNDLIALGALARLREMGVQVPEDISITGFDDIPVASFMAPPLTTVRLPKHELGKRAWKLLAARLAGESEPPSATVAPELIVRASTGPVGR